MSDSPHYPLVPVVSQLPAKVGKQLAVTEKILANRKGKVLQTNVFCVPKDGTIEEAVEKIAPGGTIKIAAGEYFLEKTLLIEKSLRLEGAGKHDTVVSGKASPYLIQVITDGCFSVEGLCFYLNLQDIENVECYGILNINAKDANISDSIFIGFSMENTNDGLTFEKNTNGIVMKCIVEECHYGIAVSDFAKLEAFENIFSNNSEAGVFFQDSSSGHVYKNRFHKNKSMGLLVSDKSVVEISENYFVENGGPGIVLMGFSSAVAVSNYCRLNIGGGVHAQNNVSVKLIDNICEQNEKGGIIFIDSASGNVSKNICRLNRSDGIHVQGNASPELNGNHCEQNEEDGIFLMGSSSSIVSANICRLNKQQGIRVQNEASAKLTENLCEENSECGIVLVGSATGISNNNICRRNKFDEVQVLDNARLEYVNEI